MRLPVQVAAVIREAFHGPTAPLFRGLRPSSVGCPQGQELCYCGSNKSACCTPPSVGPVSCHIAISGLCECG